MKKTILYLFLITFVCKQATAQLFPFDYTWENKFNYISLREDYKKGIYPPTGELMEFLMSYHSEARGHIGFFIPYYCFTKINVTPEVKQALFSILKNEWTFHEVKNMWVAVLNSSDGGIKRKYIFEKKAEELSKRNQRKDMTYGEKYVQSYDNVTKTFRDILERRIKEWSVEDWDMITIAWLGYKEAIPLLKEQLRRADSTGNLSCKEGAEIALAKLGDSASLQKVLTINEERLKNYLPQNNFSDIAAKLYFIGTQESIFRISRLMDTTKRFASNVEDDKNLNGYASSTFLFDQLLRVLDNKSLHSIFANLKKGENASDVYRENRDGIKPAETIIKVRDWLIANKGKYEINKMEISMAY